MKRKYRNGELDHLKEINVWNYGSEKAKEDCRKKISQKAKKRFAEGKGNFHWNDPVWRELRANKIRAKWKRNVKNGVGTWNSGTERSDKDKRKIRETVLIRMKEGRIPNLGVLVKARTEKEKKRIYKIVSEKRRLFLKNHPEQSVVARIFANGGENIGTSEPQENLYVWCLNKFKGERIEYNFPFVFEGRYAFGDIVFLDRRLVLEYDGDPWHKDKLKDKIRDERIIKNGFKVFRTSRVCFEEIEDMIRRCPVLGGGSYDN